jgi:hypothetical protein
MTYLHVKTQETSLLVHIRGAINRFSRSGSVIKGQSTGTPPVSAEVEGLEHNLQIC